MLKALIDGKQDVTACFSNSAIEVIRAEELASDAYTMGPRERVIEAFLKRYDLTPGDIDIVPPGEMWSSFASGSAMGEAAVVCPCSMSSLACMASGITRNLIHRVADVMLKEARPLVVAPRETPLSEIHLENMLRLKKAGAQIVPAMPAFYHRPRTLDDMTGFMAGKILDVLKIPHELFARWKS